MNSLTKEALINAKRAIEACLHEASDWWLDGADIRLVYRRPEEKEEQVVAAYNQIRKPKLEGVDMADFGRFSLRISEPGEEYGLAIPWPQKLHTLRYDSEGGYWQVLGAEAEEIREAIRLKILAK